MIIQFCGMSGSGKTTLALKVQKILTGLGIGIEVIDGDVYRKTLCAGLGFSRADRNENIRRLALLAGILSRHGIIALISAINPYEDIREEIAKTYPDVRTVYIKCSLEVLIQRDTKQLYRRAMLPDDHPEKIRNLSGVNDPFESPGNPDLVIQTDKDSIETCSEKLVQFILETVSAHSLLAYRR